MKPKKIFLAKKKKKKCSGPPAVLLFKGALGLLEGQAYQIGHRLFCFGRCTKCLAMSSKGIESSNDELCMYIFFLI